MFTILIRKVPEIIDSFHVFIGHWLSFFFELAIGTLPVFSVENKFPLIRASLSLGAHFSNSSFVVLFFFF